MRIGDIYKNLWAGYESYFVYTGKTVKRSKGVSTDTQGYGITRVSGRWIFDVAVYDRQSLMDSRHFPVVGHIDLDEQKDIFVENILSNIKHESRETVPHVCDFCKNRYVPLNEYPCSRCDKNDKPTDMFEAVE
jgi:hypothetical protein